MGRALKEEDLREETNILATEQAARLTVEAWREKRPRRRTLDSAARKR
jgi:hypothetical protein